MLRVQSPVAETISIGRGAIMAPISTLKVPKRRPGAFSHGEPPCMMAEIMFTGARKLHAIVHRGQQKRLRAAARCAGRADLLRIHIRAAIAGNPPRGSSSTIAARSGPKPQSCSRGLPKSCGVWMVSL